MSGTWAAAAWGRGMPDVYDKVTGLGEAVAGQLADAMQPRARGPYYRADRNCADAYCW